MIENIISVIFSIAYIVIMIMLLASKNEKDKKIGKAMLIIFGVVIILPVAGAILLLLTCFGMLGVAGH